MIAQWEACHTWNIVYRSAFFLSSRFLLYQRYKGPPSGWSGRLEVRLPSREITDDLELLMAVLPASIRESLGREAGLGDLIEVIMDLGRRPEARFPQRSVYLGEDPVKREQLDHVIGRVGAFTDDNRAGIERTLHRISAMRNRRDVVVGLTCRVGRAVFGTVEILRNVIESGQSLLLLGRPGIGKTTLLRESARVLSTELGKRVIVVDTSNEIAGDGDTPIRESARPAVCRYPAPTSSMP